MGNPGVSSLTKKLFNQSFRCWSCTDHHRKRGSLVVIISLRQLLDSFVDTS